MSALLSGRLSPAPTDKDWRDRSYSISYIRNCRVVFGSVPAEDIAMLAHGYGRKARVAADIAYRFGATYVIGTDKDLAALRAAKLMPCVAWQQDAQAAAEAGLPELSEWLLNGDRGRSAETVAKQLFGFPKTVRSDHPHDGGDLGRCLALLEQTNSLACIQELAAISPGWARLVPHWTVLIEAYRAEAASGRTPGTNALLDTLLAGGNAATSEQP